MVEGKNNFTGVMKAVLDIDFEGFGNLETSAPSKSIEADMKRNLTFLRRTMMEAGRG
jgi:hypothetical protein